MLRKDKAQRCQSLMEPLSELMKEPAQSCQRCGAPNPIANNFCGQCGNALTQFIGAPAILPSVPANIEKVQKPTAQALTDEGFKLGQSDDWNGAVKKYQEAINLDHSYVRAHSNLGFALNSLGRYPEAITVLDEAIKLTKDNSILHRVHDYRGFALSNLKDYEGAIEDFSKAIDYAPHNPRVHYHRAESRALAGLYDEAYADVLAALKLNPNYFQALRLKQRLDARRSAPSALL